MDDSNYQDDDDIVESGSFGKLILRLTVGILMLFHGVPKLMAYLSDPAALDGIKGMLGNLGLPPELFYGVFAGEVLGPVLVIIGLFCRFGGLLIAVNMVFAVVLAHSGELFSLTDRGAYALELQAFFLFGGVALLALGSGRIAVRAD